MEMPTLICVPMTNATTHKSSKEGLSMIFVIVSYFRYCKIIGVNVAYILFTHS